MEVGASLAVRLRGSPSPWSRRERPARWSRRRTGAARGLDPFRQKIRPITLRLRSTGYMTD